MTILTLTDPLYGSANPSPIIAQLINTPAFQRLKDISQFGPPNRYYHIQGPSRYEHSIGVYLLLHRLGASDNEQIAGLLHDVSHTAFSHIIDWVIGDSQKENFQDDRHLNVLSTDPHLSRVFSEFHLDPHLFADYHHFMLLEQPLPALCADRIDYALREFPRSVALTCVSDFIVHEGRIVSKTEQGAFLFATHFLKRQTEHWAGYEAITRYVIFSHLLRRALQEHIISLTDFYGTEEQIINTLLSSHNPGYGKTLALLENKDLSFLPRAPSPVTKKFRFVDPEVLIDGKTTKLSTINSRFRMLMKQTRDFTEKGVFPGNQSD